MAVSGLVQLMGHAAGHLAHGDQPAADLRLFGLLSGLLLGTAAGGDVGGDEHLRQPAIGPLQVAGTHVEPLVQGRRIHLARVGADVGERLGRQAGQAVFIVMARFGGECGGRSHWPARHGPGPRRQTTGGRSGW